MKEEYRISVLFFFNVCITIKKECVKNLLSHTLLNYQLKSYSCGPAATSALPASFPSYLAKFLMNL